VRTLQKFCLALAAVRSIPDQVLLCLDDAFLFLLEHSSMLGSNQREYDLMVRAGARLSECYNSLIFLIKREPVRFRIRSLPSADVTFLCLL
jgi:hypothetical protein